METVMPSEENHLSDLERQLIIDPTHLDEDIIRQPELYYTVAEQYALAASTRDKAKEQLATTDAGLNASIRHKLIEIGEKVTDSKIDALVLVHEHHNNAFSNFIDAKENTDKWIALRDSVQQRGKMLGELVQLLTIGYFSKDSLQANPAVSERIYEANLGVIDEERKRLNSSANDKRHTHTLKRRVRGTLKD